LITRDICRKSRRPVGERGAEKRGLTKVRNLFYMQRWFMRKEEVATSPKNFAETHLKKNSDEFQTCKLGKNMHRKGSEK
jgi:hypothetical protein